jgi:hypothetical protein
VPNCLFRGVEILHMELRGMENGFMTSLHLRAVLSKPVADEMGWSALLEADGWGPSVDLKSSVGKGSGTFKPNGKPQGAFSVEFDSIEKFKGIEAEDTSGGDKAKHSVKFVLKTSDKACFHALANYWMTNQRINHHFQVKFQELLDIVQPADDKKPAVKASAGLEG